MVPFQNRISTIVKILAWLAISYLLLLSIMKLTTCGLNLNEFGDYVGGVLNPFFTLLSTTAIAYLTYFIAKNEAAKADESIITQKRITLNEMRHAALNDLANKLNLFAYKLNEIPVHDVVSGSFIQRILTNNIKKEENEPNLVWLLILFEFEGFRQSKYLFETLFKKTDFNEACESFTNTISTLAEEQSTLRMITKGNLEKYIQEKQKIQTLIGDFILAEF